MEATPPHPATLSRAWFETTIAEFLRMDSDTILGRLARQSEFTVLPAQRDAWLTQVTLLKSQLAGLSGWLFLEFSIPRMGRRIDTVLIVGPIIFATAASASPSLELKRDADKVYRPLRVHPARFRASLEMGLAAINGDAIDPDRWHRAPYRPTPTIIEAARALYAQHSVEAIARYDAGAENLRVTSRRIGELVEEAKARKRKVICFLTGVPG